MQLWDYFWHAKILDYQDFLSNRDRDKQGLNLESFEECSVLTRFEMRSSLVVRASDCQCTSCNGPGFDPSIRRHSGIWGAADEAMLNIVRKKEKKSPKKYWKKRFEPFLQILPSPIYRSHIFFNTFYPFFLKGAQAWDIRDRVIYTERSHLGRWLEDWTKKIIYVKC